MVINISVSESTELEGMSCHEPLIRPSDPNSSFTKS